MLTLRKIILLMALLCGPTFAEGDSDLRTAPIIEKSNARKSITYEELRAIFTLQTVKWSDGTKITVVVLQDYHPIQRRFLWEYFGLSAARYSEIVASKTEMGMDARKPIIVASEIELVQKVAYTKGAIGFVEKTYFVNVDNKVKFVKVK